MNEVSNPHPRPRTRDLGLDFAGTPGPHNALSGVLVGYSTLISGAAPLVVGAGPVRTGVTAILPRGRATQPVVAETYDAVLNDINGQHVSAQNALVAADDMSTFKLPDDKTCRAIPRDQLLEVMRRCGRCAQAGP